MQEISILQSLKHENIVQYLGSSITGYSFNIFLEYVAGGSIASIIDRFGPIKENLTRLYTKQILSGLDYIHRRQIVHCDIKGKCKPAWLIFSALSLLLSLFASSVLCPAYPK
jgi:mitogen-activated protein kinase kinase kinase